MAVAAIDRSIGTVVVSTVGETGAGTKKKCVAFRDLSVYGNQ